MSIKVRTNLFVIALWIGWLWLVDFALGRAEPLSQGEGVAVVAVSFLLTLFATGGIYHMLGGHDFRTDRLKKRPTDLS